MTIRMRINDSLDSMLRSLERSRRKSDFLEWLRSEGFAGSDSDILNQYSWLAQDSSIKATPEPENKEDDNE